MILLMTIRLHSRYLLSEVYDVDWSAGRLVRWEERLVINRLVRSSRQRWAAFWISPIAKSVRNQNLTYLSPGKLLRLERALDSVLRQDIEGDVVEFGVALGGSAILMASKIASPRRFIGLDVFGMIPPPNPHVDGADILARYQVIASGEARGIGGDEYYGYKEDLLAVVTNQFEQFGIPVDGERVQLHQGLFEETWPTLDVSTVAYAHIDCDWYDPVAYGLAQLQDRMAVGGVIVIDDYHDYSGCRRAVDEFLIGQTDYIFEDGLNPILRRLSRSQ